MCGNTVTNTPSTAQALKKIVRNYCMFSTLSTTEHGIGCRFKSCNQPIQTHSLGGKTRVTGKSPRLWPLRASFCRTVMLKSNGERSKR